MKINAKSPSTRREWIEILSPSKNSEYLQCLPPHGGSGLKCKPDTKSRIKAYRLPPHGGSGLKCRALPAKLSGHMSPSTRREWIEICHEMLESMWVIRLPPHGGSGLKSPCLFMFTIKSNCLPPHGGSGLKYIQEVNNNGGKRSPSTRREWIEILRGSRKRST